MKRPTIVITAGEPASISPDISIRICQYNWPAKIVFITSSQLIRERAALLNITTNIHEISNVSDCPDHIKDTIVILNQELKSHCTPGKLNPLNSPFVIKSIQTATQYCLDNKADAMVTPPVHKGVINQAGVSFTGHTEFIATQCQAEPVMMLASDQLRVALLTTHLALKEVSDQVTITNLENVISILNHDLKTRFRISDPCILVCGLNPHAGEGGHLGKEEIDVIEPVISKCVKDGLNISGPYSADTIFSPKNIEKADAILAMYHDQGLPVLKYSSFGKAINITLGLPIVRVSVDHGTALELAGSSKTDIGSLKEALSLAIELS